MVLDVLIIPLRTVNLAIPNWLATGGIQVEALHRVMATAKLNVLLQHYERIMEARQWLPPAGSPTSQYICGQWTKQLYQQDLPKSCSASAGKLKCRRMSLFIQTVLLLVQLQSLVTPYLWCLTVHTVHPQKRKW